MRRLWPFINISVQSNSWRGLKFKPRIMYSTCGLINCIIGDQKISHLAKGGEGRGGR